MVLLFKYQISYALICSKKMGISMKSTVGSHINLSSHASQFRNMPWNWTLNSSKVTISVMMVQDLTRLHVYKMSFLVLLISYLWAGAVQEKWLDDFEAGATQHDLVVKQARYDLSGTYRCEAIESVKMDYWDVWETEVVVAGWLIVN